jgi:predicted transcriptional regulator
MDYEAADKYALRMAKAQEFRDLLAACGLTQRGAARFLQISDRAVRYYASGQEDIPRVVWLALDALKKERLTP